MATNTSSGKAGMLVAVWKNQYPPASPRRAMPLEKALSLLITCLSFLSLGNLKSLFQKDSYASHAFMDFYVAAWAVLLYVALFSRDFFVGGFATPVAVWLAAYRIFDIIIYRVFFLLVKSQSRPWTGDLLRRSVLIAVVNLFEVVAAFAILYSRVPTIAQSGSTTVSALPPGVAVYFSLVSMLTVGYGDYVPLNANGRWLVIAQLSTTILFVIFLVPALVSVFSPALTDHKGN